MTKRGRIIAGRVKSARQAAGLKQGDFEVDQSTVKRIEGGKLKGQPELETIESLSKTLKQHGVSEATPAYLLGLE